MRYASRIVLAAGLLILVAGLVGLGLPVLPGWPFTFMALPLLVVAIGLHIGRSKPFR